MNCETRSQCVLINRARKSQVETELLDRVLML